jgi:hypothetical protein
MPRKATASMTGMLVVPDDIQPDTHTATQLSDADIPAGDVVAPAPVVAAPAAAPAVEAQPVKAKPAKPEPKELAQRPLYAHPETLDLIRTLAFQERTTAQALYREGLHLMLKKRGHFKDRPLGDV